MERLSMYIGDAPTLFFFKESIEKAASKGTILFYHGLGSRKEDQVKELTSLAENGFLAVGIDNVAHGERRHAQFDELFSDANSENWEKIMTETVIDTVKEIPFIIQYLQEKKWIQRGNIGIVGISMGGFIAYGAPIIFPEMKVTVPILGAPKWKIEHKESPHLFPEHFYPTALLIQNAGKDQSVPPCTSREFYEKLLPFYNAQPERLRYVEFPNSGHFMEEEDWNILWENVVHWFERFFD